MATVLQMPSQYPAAPEWLVPEWVCDDRRAARMYRLICGEFPGAVTELWAGCIAAAALTCATLSILTKPEEIAQQIADIRQWFDDFKISDAGTRRLMAEATA